MGFEDVADVLEDAPDNWGRWGEDDEIGALNYLDSEQILRGVQAIEEGETFSLGLPVARPEGDATSPSRAPNQHFMSFDKGSYESGKRSSPDGSYAADDVINMPLHGTSHVDALGHFWYGDELYNGFDAETTKGGLERCSVGPIAEHGIVGHGVLLDIARHRGVDWLEHGSRITLDELQECAAAQGTEIERRDIPIIRTGFVERFYDEGPDNFYGEDFHQPGLTYSDELVEWFYDMEIPAFATDTLINEQRRPETTDTLLPLHASLLRDLGVLFIESLRLDDLAAACHSDDQYAFMFVSSPLKVAQGTGSPINPLAIR